MLLALQPVLLSLSTGRGRGGKGAGVEHLPVKTIHAPLCYAINAGRHV